MKHFIRNSILTIELDNRLYSEDIVFKSMYWLLKDYIISITPLHDNCLIIVIESKEEIKDDFDSLIRKIKELLIDFKTRSIIQIETKVIRELLIAKAFSASDEFDTMPPGKLEDTVGVDMTDFE